MRCPTCEAPVVVKLFEVLKNDAGELREHPSGYPLPRFDADAVISQRIDALPETFRLTCGFCGGKEMHGQGEHGPCPKCDDTGLVLVERAALRAALLGKETT